MELSLTAQCFGIFRSFRRQAEKFAVVHTGIRVETPCHSSRTESSNLDRKAVQGAPECRW